MKKIYWCPDFYKPMKTLKCKSSKFRSFDNKFLGRSNHLYQNKNHLYKVLYHWWTNTIQNVLHHLSHIHLLPTATDRCYRCELAFLFRFFIFQRWKSCIFKYFSGLENESVPDEWTVLFRNHWKFFKWFKRIIFRFC